MILAIAPGNLFHFHVARWTIDPSHRIHEVHGDPPQGHELEAPLGQAVVAGPHLAAARADRSPVAAGFDLNFDCRPVGIVYPSGFSVDERLEILDAIATRLRIVLSCILWWLREDELFQTHLYRKPHRMHFFLFQIQPAILARAR